MYIQSDIIHASSSSQASGVVYTQPAGNTVAFGAGSWWIPSRRRQLVLGAKAELPPLVQLRPTAVSGRSTGSSIHLKSRCDGRLHAVFAAASIHLALGTRSGFRRAGHNKIRSDFCGICILFPSSVMCIISYCGECSEGYKEVILGSYALMISAVCGLTDTLIIATDTRLQPLVTPSPKYL